MTNISYKICKRCGGEGRIIYYDEQFSTQCKSCVGTGRELPAEEVKRRIYDDWSYGGGNTRSFLIPLAPNAFV